MVAVECLDILDLKRIEVKVIQSQQSNGILVVDRVSDSTRKPEVRKTYIDIEA